MSDLFYRAFEEKFRGSRSLIRSRLGVYRAFISPLKQICSDARGLDLGCGRGEWLEVLREEGIEPTGVDLDEGMLEASRALHLPAMKGDAVAYLASLPSESQAVISAFHMVEHIPFDQLQLVVSEALRVLKPGGLLIMETPNPENINVATCHFYLDPTHQRPIPPLLLAFLPEHFGFFRTKLLRLQQETRLEEEPAPRLWDVLGGASPDYAVIAQKDAAPELLQAFDVPFRQDYGLTLHTLATRYDLSSASRHEATNQLAQQAIATADNAASSASNASSIAQQAIATADNAASSASNASSIAQQAMAMSQQTRDLIAGFESRLWHFQIQTTAAEQRINALLSSTSWRATAPLRWLSTGMRKWLAFPWRVFKRVVRTPMLAAMNFVLQRPPLRLVFSAAIKRHPRLAHHLHLLAIHRGLMEKPSPPFEPPPSTHETTAASDAPATPLTPHAQRIHEELVRAIAQQNARDT
ncbi:MAG: class I SAM-dependent methyltransferase [Hydrogenophaga sp.]|uniref:class I SAM-dependent methyltransferase n=1 Tax=Hydrogenophaga sp. TaxID=1904254 RepID=UPI002730FCAF|nr:class I SAM-dependent methyltransferase [Hydrogenophaga sp.]MDP2406956.1 class I SAM-dependent methyltransferase [Hydrogenophaga sp.]MDZ4175280.1 class I SAM-dependent methyltransferase [Hydrogenophaga sp.]